MSVRRARLEALFLILLLAGAIALLQAHAIIFWMEHVGSLGWAWSVLLEAVALWLWYGPNRARLVLAFVASCLLLLGPVSHVSAPLIEDLVAAPHRDEARLARIDALSDQRGRLVESLETFRTNSLARSGWLPAIERTQSLLQDVDSELAELLAQPPQKPLAWRDQAVIVMQVLVLLLFQVSAVLAIRTLSRRSHEAAAKVPDEGSAASKDKSGLKAANAEQSLRPPAAQLSKETPAPARRQEPVVVSAPVRDVMTTPPLPQTTETKLDADEAEADYPMGKGCYSLEDIQRIREELDRHLARVNLSQSAFCREHDYPGRDLSLLRRHEERVENGERTISETSLKRLESILRASAA